MLDAALARANTWMLEHIDPKWIDYVASNTMTDLNRRLNGFIWTYELQAQVVAVRDEAPGVKTFVMRPNQLWQGFEPGQHVELVLPIKDVQGLPVKRFYSVSPQPQGRFSITVKQTRQGRASRWLHERLQVGQRLPISQAQGRFCRRTDQARLLYLCAGSGITPCHSMVSAALAGPAAQRPDMQVIAQFREADDLIFKDDLAAWKQAGVKVDTLFSSGSPQGLPASRLDAEHLRRLCPDLAGREVYLCGPEGFMHGMIQALQSLGVDPLRIHTERFTVSHLTPSTGFSVAGTEVRFKHIDACFTMTAADEGKTLLQAALDHGVNLERGCTQGMCGTCKLSVHEGEISGNVLGRTVYMCTSYPASRQIVLGP